jgi:Arylsulfotransferase (ASST)
MRCVRALILGPSLALGLGLAGLTATAAAQSAPTCVPTSLEISALQAGAVTVSPLPGSRDASPRTQVSFLGVPVNDLIVVGVAGSRSGLHPGRLEGYSQGDGASFVPARPFVEGERVTVHAKARVGGVWRPLLDVFAVARPDAISSTPERVHPGSPSEQQSFVSRPDLHPPTVTVTASSPAVAAGDVFIAPYGGPGQPGPMILDPAGGLVWFKPLPRYTSATNFHVQEYLGRPVLTWWQGDISVHGFGTGEDVIADSAYEEIGHVRAGNGHLADLHEFQLTPQGTALITSYFPVLCNLSSVGGSSYAGLTDGVFQEIDVRTGLVMYEWTSLDHVPLRDSYSSPRRSSTATPYDFFHINSLSFDRDGSLLISARNTWTVYDLDPATGLVRWRLGGKRPSFAGTPETRTAWQHDPQEQADGSISLFDNGSSPTVHPQSRGIVVRLDPQTGTVALALQLTHTPALVAESQGNIQALPNGDWFIGWGQEPFFSELGPTGQQLFAANLPAREQSYRSFRQPWTGTPSHAPSLAFVAGGAGGGGTVYASWNGATLVASWRVEAGASPRSLHAILTAPRGGFETAIALPGGTIGPYLEVQALDAAGNVLHASRAVRDLPAG